MKRLLVMLIAAALLLPTAPLLAESFEGVNYSVIEKATMGKLKCNMDIRLSKKVTKDFLKRLALKLRNDEPIRYESMFICYYTPGMTVGTGAWATTHFSPNLEVKILGMTEEEEEGLRTSSQAPIKNIIGQWLDDSPYTGNKTTLLKEKDKVFMIREFRDGSRSRKEMVQKSQGGLKRFEDKEGGSLGEYYLIDGRGRLSIYDDEGLFKTLPPIK